MAKRNRKARKAHMDWAAGKGFKVPEPKPVVVEKEPTAPATKSRVGMLGIPAAIVATAMVGIYFWGW